MMMDEPDLDEEDLLWDNNHDHDSEPLLGASFRMVDTLSRPRLVCGFMLFLLLGMAPQFLQNAIFSEVRWRGGGVHGGLRVAPARLVCDYLVHVRLPCRPR
jgi:hypothetical protein